MTKPDTLLITEPHNIRYLSGFSGEGILLLKKQKKILITDSRYLLRARAESKKDFRISVAVENFEEIFRKALKTLQVKQLGYEARHLTVANLKSLQKKAHGLKIKFVPSGSEIEKQRQIKSPAETQKIRKSCQLTARILKTVVSNLKAGKSELEVAAEIQILAAKFGAEKLAFDSVVAFGANSACPHAKATKKRLKRGDLVKIDLGVMLDGYASDMTRTFFTAEPNTEQRETYAAVLTAQRQAIASIKSGMKAKNVADSVKAFFTEKKIAKYFTHSLGHGVGLQIHEAPSLSEKSKDVLTSGNVVTVEPGIYFPKKYGIRIEDTVVVKKQGVDILTKFPKNLRVLKI